jgi:glutaredoxin
MNKKVLLSTILFIIILIFSLGVLLKNKTHWGGRQNQQDGKNQIILFYSDSCPHCAVVEEYLKENQVEKKVSFTKKEVYHNQENAQELKEKAKICRMSSEAIGLPFLWDGEKCFVGDKDIIEFFRKKVEG